jgi:hypothetical protein
MRGSAAAIGRNDRPLFQLNSKAFPSSVPDMLLFADVFHHDEVTS